MSSKTIRWISTTPDRPWQERPVTPGAKGTADLSISGTRHQVWEAFGGCFNELGWIALSALSASARKKVLTELFDSENGCRFTRCRIPIGASDYGAEWYSCNETDGDFSMEHFSIERDRKFLIPYIQEALDIQDDLEFFASPWSPPTWMKFPKAYNYGTLVWKPEYLNAYARYFQLFVQAYRDEGINVTQLHVQNEVVADQKFPSCLWTGDQLREFIGQYLGPLFEKELPDCEVWLGTLNTSDYDAFPNTVLTDPDAHRYVAGVGFQWDGKGAIQRTAEAWPEIRLMQTENECGEGKNSWEYARYIFGLFRHYITNGAHAYIYWNMILQPGGKSTWGWTQNAMVTVDPATKKVTYNPEFYVMKHFSRFIDPGATRLGLAGPWTANAVAFANPDGSTVVVIGNPFPDARPFTFQGEKANISATLDGYSFNTFVIE